MFYSKDATQKSYEGLVSRAKSGDTKAFAAIYDAFITRLYRFVYSRVGNRQDSEDIVAEVWKSIWESLPRYQSKNFTGFIFRIAYTKIVDYFRNVKHTVCIDEAVFLADKKKTPEQRVIEDEQSEQLKKALHMIPSMYQSVITLREIEGFSVQETAVIIQKSSIAVRVIHFRAMRMLKKLLKDI